MLFPVFACRQRSCGKVMFSRCVSFSPRVWEEKVGISGAMSVTGPVFLPEGRISKGGVYLLRYPTLSPNYKSGWYASYWNTFLLFSCRYIESYSLIVFPLLPGVFRSDKFSVLPDRLYDMNKKFDKKK